MNNRPKLLDPVRNKIRLKNYCIHKRAHKDRPAIFLAGHPKVPSLSVASPTPMGLFYPLNIQVYLERLNLPL